MSELKRASVLELTEAYPEFARHVEEALLVTISLDGAVLDLGYPRST